MPVISATQKAEVRGSQSEAGPRQKPETLSEKLTKAKRAVDVTQVVEYLPSKHKTLNSIPGTTKTKRLFNLNPSFLMC
jgi:hypothetical protein